MLIAITFAGCAEKKDQLNIFIWSEYLDPDVVAEFESQFNCRVVIDHFEDPESLLAKMFAGGDSSYDIIVADHRTITVLTNGGMIAPLDKDAIPNLKHIDPRFRSWDFNPDLKYGVPYHWGTTGLLMRQAPGTSVDETWGLLFDPENQPGQFLLMDDMRSALGIALLYAGHSVNSADPKALSAAADLLIATKKRALGFEPSILARNRILAKESAAAMVYSDHSAKGLAQDPELKYFIPREGGLIWQDILCIPARAPHPELAEQFLNFINEPEICGRNTTFVYGATANLAAREFVDPAQLKNSAIYLPDGALERVEFDYELGEASKLYDEIWTKIKSK